MRNMGYLVSLRGKRLRLRQYGVQCYSVNVEIKENTLYIFSVYFQQTIRGLLLSMCICTELFLVRNYDTVS